MIFLSEMRKSWVRHPPGLLLLRPMGFAGQGAMFDGEAGALTLGAGAP